jgi:hypothetical protein
VSGVQSVTGWVPDTGLGFTLVHKHVAASSAGILRSWPGLSGGRENLIATAVAALVDAKTVGVRTIVDCTTFDLGRDGGRPGARNARHPRRGDLAHRRGQPATLADGPLIPQYSCSTLPPTSENSPRQ